MKCQKYEALFNLYLDNELTTEKRRLVEKHLETCPDCREVFESLASLVKLAHELETVQPATDDWPALKHALTRSKRNISFSSPWSCLRDMFRTFPPFPRFVPFAGFSVILLTAFLLWFMSPRPNDQSEHHLENLHKTATLHFEEAEYHYKLAIKSLNQAIDTRKEKLDPQCAQVFERNLTILDDSIRSCQTAIAHNPNNLNAHKYLLICYRKKIELLNEFQTLSAYSG
ncbi:zf-HC2 domain-containing protein [bacterium]|nr:zf-HC2 domain-containing protein [bacterium]